jgi:hypothetical protein
MVAKTISIWFSEMISGGERTSVSPLLRMRTSSSKHHLAHSAPRAPRGTVSGRKVNRGQQTDIADIDNVRSVSGGVGRLLPNWCQPPQRQTHDRVMKTWREEIEAMHGERCLITLTLHPRSDYGSARASRIAALDRLLTWLGTLPGVAFMRCDEIAAAAEDIRSKAHRL